MATIIPAPLPSDWPSVFIMHVKDEAAAYASELRGMFPDPSALVEAATERLMKRIEADAYDVESEESWFDRYESGALEAEIAAALEHYRISIASALAE